MNRRRFLRTSAAAAGAALAAPIAARGEQRGTDAADAEADARIEKARKADATVAVVDAEGKPVPGAAVTVEQTRHAFLFGSNIFGWRPLDDERQAGNGPLQEAYRRQFDALLNYATLGFYWASYEPQRGRPQHESREQIAQWCREHGIATKGHPLAWNYADPRWLPDDAEEVLRLQLARIEDCVGRFAGLIDRWDVVNEATHFDRESFVRRAPKMTAMWSEAGQVEFTRQCFQRARAANPQATLLINDYRTDPAYERVIERLVDAGGRRLYDVIGIQSHMHGGVWDDGKIWEVCERFARFGVPLHFTETTILSGERTWEKNGPWPSTPEGEAYQADHVARFYTTLFSHPAVEAITWWDFSDRGAWKGAPAGFLRRDMTPKPAYARLVDLIHNRWWTRTKLTTGPDGTAPLRGFLGDYSLKVTAGGTSIQHPATLSRNADNRWQIRLG